MKIEVMTAAHIEQVSDLERQCFSQPWSKTVLESELKNPNGVFLVAQEAGQLAGYAGMHCVLDEGYLANVAVDQGFRRQGVATALLNGLLEIARQKRLGFLTLEVRQSNSPAIGVYSGLGFGEVGRRRNFYANPIEDAVLMTLFL